MSLPLGGFLPEILARPDCLLYTRPFHFSRRPPNRFSAHVTPLAFSLRGSATRLRSSLRTATTSSVAETSTRDVVWGFPQTSSVGVQALRSQECCASMPAIFTTRVECVTSAGANDLCRGNDSGFSHLQGFLAPSALLLCTSRVQIVRGFGRLIRFDHCQSEQQSSRQLTPILFTLAIHGSPSAL